MATRDNTRGGNRNPKSYRPLHPEQRPIMEASAKKAPTPPKNVLSKKSPAQKKGE